MGISLPSQVRSRRRSSAPSTAAACRYSRCHYGGSRSFWAVGRPRRLPRPAAAPAWLLAVIKAPPMAAIAAARIAAAMNSGPALVEGPGRLASVMLGDGNVVAKSGAQGVFAFALRREKLGRRHKAGRRRNPLGRRPPARCSNSSAQAANSPHASAGTSRRQSSMMPVKLSDAASPSCGWTSSSQADEGMPQHRCSSLQQTCTLQAPAQ